MGRQAPSDNDTDQQGRFPGNGNGQSIDERLPMKNEKERRLAKTVAAGLEGFLKLHPRATWDFAAGPALHHAVLDQLDASVRRRMLRAELKELARAAPAELLTHFPIATRTTS
jgi:hypothetical protein